MCFVCVHQCTMCTFGCIQWVFFSYFHACSTHSHSCSQFLLLRVFLLNFVIHLNLVVLRIVIVVFVVVVVYGIYLLWFSSRFCTSFIYLPVSHSYIWLIHSRRVVGRHTYTKIKRKDKTTQSNKATYCHLMRFFSSIYMHIQSRHSRI